MSKAAKISIALGVSVVFLLVSFSILVKVVVTPEKVRETLLPLAKDALQREIEIGGIDIGIFSGVTLNDLRVQKKETPDDFISVGLVVLNYKLLALLTGDIVIDRVIMEEPRIEVVRFADGSFNFSDLTGNTDSKPAEKKAAANETDQSSGGKVDSPLDLLIKKASISGGELIFVDRSHNSNAPYRYSFSQLNFDASDITLEKAFPIKFSAQLNGSQIDLSGRYDISSQSGELDLQLNALDLVKFSPYYRNALPGKLSSAQLSLSLEVLLRPEHIDSKGKLQLEQLDLSLNDLPQAAFKQARVGVDYALAFDLKKQRLSLSTFLLNFNDSVVGAEGHIDLSAADPHLQMAILLDHLDLRQLLEGLPKGLSRDLEIYSLAGKIDGRIALAGSANSGAKLLQSADLTLIDVRATVAEKRAGINGTIKYRDDTATTQKLILKMADQQLQLDFKAENLTGDLVRGEFLLAADTLNLNQLLPQDTVQQAAEGSGPVAEGPLVERRATLAEEVGPFDLPVDMTGRLQVGKLIYNQLEMTRARADVVLKDNHLKINPLRTDLAGGELNLVADVNLGVKGLQYQGQMKVDQSNLMGVAAGLVPQAEQSISGLLQWQNNFSGRGTQPDNLLQSLQVKGAMLLQQGQISGSPLLEQISLFLGIPDLKVLSFDALEGRYDLRNGLASLDGQLNSSKTKLVPKGTVGVDGALDMKLDARIAPELLQKMGVKSGLKKVVSDQNGWGVLPLAIKGTLSRPKIAFDSEALQQQAADKLKQEAANRLFDKLGSGTEAEQKPVKQLLEGTLNRLFGN